MLRFWRAETAFFVGLWLLLAIVGRGSLFQDPGTFWHTVVGRHILASGEVPHCDTLSFTFGGRPWVATQWLAECLMAAVHNWLGWDGLLLLTVTCLAGIFTLVASRLLQSGLHVVPTILMVTLVAAASSHHFHARPHLMTLLLVPLLTAMLVDVERGRHGPQHLWWCLPLFLVWTNMHGGALAGWGMLLLAAMGWVVWRWRRWSSPLDHRAAFCHVLGVVTLCGLAMIVTPYGFDTPRTWLQIMSLDLPDLIEEHAPLDWRKPEGLATLLLACGYVSTLVSTWPRRPRIVWLLPLLWAWLAMGRVRHAPLFALSATVAWADMLPCSRLAGWLQDKGWLRDMAQNARGELSTPSWRAPSQELPTNVAGTRADWRPWLAPCLLVLTAMSLQAGDVGCPVLGRGWARLDPRIWPVDLVEQLNAGQEAGLQSDRMFNSLDLGGFVAFFAPGLRTFIDDRCELFGGDFLRKYAAAEAGQAQELDRWAEEFNIQHALVRPGSPFDIYLAEASGWQQTGRGAAAVLYQRRPSTLAVKSLAD